MRHVVDKIAYPLTHIYNLSFLTGIIPNELKLGKISPINNLSFLTGIIPNELKLGKISPIYKNGDPMFFTNYRPIAVLPVLSKVIERLLYNRLMDYLKKENSV